MVWPILISVAVTPRISAADEITGKVMSATAPGAAHPADRRIGFAPHICSPLRTKRQAGIPASTAKHATARPGTPATADRPAPPATTATAPRPDGKAR